MSFRLSYSSLKSAYQKSPFWLQRMFSAIPPSLRAGPKYRETQKLILETEWLSEADLHVRQDEALRRLLVHAAKHVPFYQDFFRDRGQSFSPETFDLSRIDSLPLVSKREIQVSNQSFVATGGVGEPTYADNTGASSGTPFRFYKSNSMYPIELAYMHAQWRRVGYQPYARKLTLRGRQFGQSQQDKWLYNPIYNELVISSYHLNEKTLALSLKEVERFRPQYIHGYPSAIVAFLDVIRRAGLTPPKGIKAVLCGSEPLYPYQRQLIQNMLGARAYTWYGQSECVLLAGECETEEEYHSFPLYGILELIDSDGRVITKPDVEGEIVGTGLNNYAMPFIRYRTGDRGVISPGGCRCGRNYPRLKKVVGRIQHYIHTATRTRVPITAFIFGQHFNAFTNIHAMQLVQDEPGHIKVRICKGQSYSEVDEREMRDKMSASVDHALKITFEYVAELPRNNAGKVDFVIQNVTEDQ
jgi:phenylacetate-CoA ligase